MTMEGDMRARHNTVADTTSAVDAFMQELVHPFKAEIEELRALILGADSHVAEGIKWKAPSFRTQEYFATVHLREKEGLVVILHLGAKVRELGPGQLSIPDPEGLLKWLAADRARVRFASKSDWQAKKTAFEKIVRVWVRHV
jgi:hypothetical protein